MKRVGTIGRRLQLLNRLVGPQRHEPWKPTIGMFAINQLAERHHAALGRLLLGIVDRGQLMLAFAIERFGREVRFVQTFQQQAQTERAVDRQHLDRAARGVEREQPANVFNRFGNLLAGMLGGSLVEQLAHQRRQSGLDRRFAQRDVVHVRFGDDDRQSMIFPEQQHQAVGELDTASPGEAKTPPRRQLRRPSPVPSFRRLFARDGGINRASQSYHRAQAAGQLLGEMLPLP